MTLFAQDIVIDDLNYTCFILNNDLNNYNLIISGNGIQYSNIINNDDETYKTLTSSIREKAGLKCLYNFEKNNTILKLDIIHETMKLNISYILKIVDKDCSFNTIINNRIQKLEDNETKIYPLKDKYFGPCVIIPEESYLLPDYVYSKLNSKDNNEYGKVSPYLLNYYNKKYVFQDEIPICSKNQLLFNGIKNSINNSDNNNLYNTYTILTKKYNNDVVGLITKNNNHISINLASKKFNFKHSNISSIRDTYTENNVQYYKFSTQDFFKNGYIIEFPFKVEDNIYIDKYSQIMMIKNNKLYNTSFLKNNGFIVNNGSDIITLNDLTVELN